jgi:hypothetical protein
MGIRKHLTLYHPENDSEGGFKEIALMVLLSPVVIVISLPWWIRGKPTPWSQ